MAEGHGFRVVGGCHVADRSLSAREGRGGVRKEEINPRKTNKNKKFIKSYL